LENLNIFLDFGGNLCQQFLLVLFLVVNTSVFPYTELNYYRYALALDQRKRKKEKQKQEKGERKNFLWWESGRGSHKEQQ